MKATHFNYRIVVAATLAACIFFAAASSCPADVFSRSGKGEIFGAWQFLDGDTAAEPRDKVDMDDACAYGLGLAYNLNDHFNINTDLSFARMDTTRTRTDLLGATTRKNPDADLFIWNVNLDYNIFPTRFTPVVSGGLGLVNFSGGAFSEIDFASNLAAGLRWDITDDIFVKATYRFLCVQLRDFDDTAVFDGISVVVGFTFGGRRE